jgi:O-methyltransferase
MSDPISIVRRRIRYWAECRRLERIYRRYAGFTMISLRDYMDNLRLAGSVRGVPGCVVECGVWRGGMSAGLAAILGPGRTYYLCDSFEGLPPAAEIDGLAARQWQNSPDGPNYHDNCRAALETAKEAMALTGAPSVRFIPGWFNATLPDLKLDAPIALLRLDGDWYESTMTCLENLYDQVAPGGLILIDDYYTWDGCSRAVHDFLSRRKAVERIEQAGAVCYLRKAKPAGSA